MILSDADILRRLEQGDLVVEPLDDPDIQIQPASVDLRLGHEFLEFQHANIPCIHPNSEDEVSDYVEETVVEEDEEFILHPGDFVLGTTHERVAIPDDSSPTSKGAPRWADLRLWYTRRPACVTPATRARLPSNCRTSALRPLRSRPECESRSSPLPNSRHPPTARMGPNAARSTRPVRTAGEQDTGR